MPILNKYDLKLIGNATVDYIYVLPQWASQGTSNIFHSYKISVGGICNIISSLSRQLNVFAEFSIGDDFNGKIIKQFLLQNKISNKLHISSNPTSQSLILSCLKSKERTSFVNWGAGADIFMPSKKRSKWTHISYLDIVPTIDLEIIRQYTDTLSADLCLSSPSKQNIKLILSRLHLLDYLFVSEAEVHSLTSDISHLITTYNLPCLIFHTRKNTTLLKKNYHKVILNKNVINNINVLGAGDAYCANFISNKLKYNSDLVSIQYAHKQATNFILQKQ